MLFRRLPHTKTVIAKSRIKRKFLMNLEAFYFIMATNWIACLVACCVLFQIGCEAFGQQRLVGGSTVRGSIPYQISLQAKADSGILDTLLQLLLMQSRSEWKHFCGGSIISDTHAVTAAHCLDGADQTKISVLAGTSSRIKGGERHSIQSYVIHPQYRKLQTNDIAIITVTEPFVFSASVQSIEFRDTKFVGGGTRVKLSGWGYTTPLATLSLPMSLRTIDLRTITNEQCRQQGYNVSLSEICTSTGVLRGACMGDSGGPLVNTERNVLIGLVSYGSRICGAGRPEVYTRISEFCAWICEQIGDTSFQATTPTTTTISTTTTAPATEGTTAPSSAESTAATSSTTSAPPTIASTPTTTTYATTSSPDTTASTTPTSTTIDSATSSTSTTEATIETTTCTEGETIPLPTDPPVFPVAPVMPASASMVPSKPSSSTIPKPKPVKLEVVPDPSFAAELDRIKETSKPNPQAATIIIEYKKGLE